MHPGMLHYRRFLKSLLGSHDSLLKLLRRCCGFLLSVRIFIGCVERVPRDARPVLWISICIGMGRGSPVGNGVQGLSKFVEGIVVNITRVVRGTTLRVLRSILVALDILVNCALGSSWVLARRS